MITVDLTEFPIWAIREQDRRKGKRGRSPASLAEKKNQGRREIKKKRKRNSHKFGLTDQRKFFTDNSNQSASDL